MRGIREERSNKGRIREEGKRRVHGVSEARGVEGFSPDGLNMTEGGREFTNSRTSVKGKYFTNSISLNPQIPSMEYG